MQLQREEYCFICIFFGAYLKQTVSANIPAHIFVHGTFMEIIRKRAKMYAAEMNSLRNLNE